MPVTSLLESLVEVMEVLVVPVLDSVTSGKSRLEKVLLLLLLLLVVVVLVFCMRVTLQKVIAVIANR